MREREPVRMRSDESTPAELRGLVGSSRWSRPMSAETRARSVARVERLVAVPAAAGLLLWLKGVAIAASVGVVAGVVAAYTLPSHTPASANAGLGATAPSPPAARAPRVTESPTTTPPTVTSALATTIGSAPAPRKRLSPPSSATKPTSIEPPLEDSLAREAAMLEEARSALDRAPAEALARLDEHAADFPTGALAPERELLAIEALRRLGRFADARRRGEALLASSRGGLYEDRVRKTLLLLEPRPSESAQP